MAAGLQEFVPFAASMMLNAALYEALYDLIAINEHCEMYMHIRFKTESGHILHIGAKAAHIDELVLGKGTTLGHITEALHCKTAELYKRYLIFVGQQLAAIDVAQVEQCKIRTVNSWQHTGHVNKKLCHRLTKL